MRGPASFGRDCVAPGDGELRVSAASGPECGAQCDVGRRGLDAAGRDCVDSADFFLFLESVLECLLLRHFLVMLMVSLRRVAGTGNMLSQLRIAILTLVRLLSVLSVVVHVVLVVHA